MTTPDKYSQESTIPIFLYPGTVFVSNRNHEVFTVLGSCVSVCLWDKERKIGGINHFLLASERNHASTSAKYGDFAIEQLIQKMTNLGSRKQNLWAKVFGGANQLNKKGTGFRVGACNVKLAFQQLQRENVPIISSHTGGDRGRKIRFNVRTGEVILLVL